MVRRSAGSRCFDWLWGSDVVRVHCRGAKNGGVDFLLFTKFHVSCSSFIPCSPRVSANPASSGALTCWSCRAC